MKLEQIRHRVWELLEVAEKGDRASHAVDVFLLSLIFLNVAAVIVQSVERVEAHFGGYLLGFEIFSVAVFTIEYLARLWSCTASAKFSGAIVGRVRFVFRPGNLVDLLAFAPAYLPFFGGDTRAVRVLRLMRIFRVARLGAYSQSVGFLGRIIRSRKEELIVSGFFMAMLVVIASTLMYHLENGAQPEKFTDIPTTMWWTMVTITTLGYGDVYPITAAGRALASCVAVLGIGMFALPTAVFGSGFLEEMERRRGRNCCPHCGKEVK